MPFFCNMGLNAGIMLLSACRSPHYRFDGDFYTTAQGPLATEGRPSGKERLADKSITPPLYPQRQTADS